MLLSESIVNMDILVSPLPCFAVITFIPLVRRDIKGIFQRLCFRPT